VQIVEFDVPADAPDGVLVGTPLRQAEVPPDSKVAGLIRGDRMIFPHGDEEIRPGDRIVVIASPDSARAWSRILAHGQRTLEDVVIFGAGRMGTTIARALLEHDMHVRLIDSRQERAHDVAEELPDARVFHADAFDPSFLERLRLDEAAAVFCMNDDARNLYGAVLAKVHGVRLTIALVHDPASAAVYERGGVDVAINPRQATAEEMVRFAHDPRVKQIAMLEGDRFEVLDITVSPESKLANKRFKDLPTTDALIGAVIRDDAAFFPHGSDVLRAGDRVIMFVESSSAWGAARIL
jgi:trk system potassium uptake protein